MVKSIVTVKLFLIGILLPSKDYLNSKKIFKIRDLSIQSRIKDYLETLRIFSLERLRHARNNDNDMLKSCNTR